MKVVKLRIDGQQFFLPTDTDVSALQEQILDAARGRAAFVSFRPVGHGVISVLVTANLPVRFEVEEHAESEVDDWEEHPPAIDDHDLFPSF